MEKLIRFLCSAVFCIAVALGMPQIAKAAKVTINETNFPDEIFREYVLKQFDIDKNEVLSEDEIKNIKYINIDEGNIANLKGIEYFTDLVTLRCAWNQLTSLDVSQNPNLTDLWCNWNQLTNLNIGQNPNLISLHCESNQLTSLDVSQNTSLTHLFCESNRLTSLDIRQNPNLTTLRCSGNRLINLDVSQNTSLTQLYCKSNSLISLDVSKNPNLIWLDCSSNQLISLDISQNPSLTELTCISNQLISLDISKNLNLMWLNCSSNQLISLDVSQNSSLEQLHCESNQLTSLDISHNPSLDELYCYSNQLTSLKLNKQVYYKLSLENRYLHSEDHSDNIPTTATATLSNLSNVTETNGIIKVIDINKPATYQYTYDGKKINFTILYVDPDENPEKTFKITYVLNGGTNAVENPTVYVEGIGVASFANATKLNATFDGWYLDAAFTQKITSIGADQTGDIILYAKFISSDLNNVVTSFCERLFYDYEYKDSVSGTAITLYGNCKKNTDTIKKDCILYTDILASYDYSINKGKVKTSTGKVIVGITMSDTKPTITKNKIIDSEAAKIAKAKIKNGQITVTATGKASGVIYLWVMDTGNKGVWECCPINVKLAPKKLEVQETTGNKASKLKIANGTSKEVKIAGFVGTTKTDDCTYTAIVDSKSQNYVSVTTLDDKSFTLKGTGLKNNKDTKISITFTCKENGKKVKFTATITKPTT